MTGIQLPYKKIGAGLVFGHYSCIIINTNTKIGENCTILQGVTIGSIRGKGVPCIGNNVLICANSMIIGDIKIGKNVVIGAGSIVTKDVLDNATVAGNPAKIISYDSKIYI